MTTKKELRVLLAKARAAREESLQLYREGLAEMRRADAEVRARRTERLCSERMKDESILSRLRAGGPSASERGICRDLHVSPKRVVRLRALLGANERSAPAES